MQDGVIPIACKDAVILGPHPFFETACNGANAIGRQKSADPLLPRKSSGCPPVAKAAAMNIPGEYTACLNEKEIILKPGDELYIPKGTEPWGKYVAGTRTIHAFGGNRTKK